MEEFRKRSKLIVNPRDRNDTKRREAWKEMRRVIEERRKQNRMNNESESESESQPESESESTQQEEPDSSLLNNALKQEKRRESEYRKLDEAVSPAPSRTTATATATATSSTHHENGWNQGDGRRAEQLVIYEGNIPETIRNRIEPTKGTHFRFRNSSDEQKFIQALSSPSQTAVYQSKGKKDVTITSSDGELIGNVHFLHMDGPDIHRPEKYYVKFYLFNFTDSNALRNVKQKIQQFFSEFSSTPSPQTVHRPRFSKQTRKAAYPKKRVNKLYHKLSHKKRRSIVRL